MAIEFGRSISELPEHPRRPSGSCTTLHASYLYLHTLRNRPPPLRWRTCRVCVPINFWQPRLN